MGESVYNEGWSWLPRQRALELNARFLSFPVMADLEEVVENS